MDNLQPVLWIAIHRESLKNLCNKLWKGAHDLAWEEFSPKPITIHLPKVHSQAITSPQTLTYFRGNNGIRFESKFSAFDKSVLSLCPKQYLPLIKALAWFWADESLHRYQWALARHCYQTQCPRAGFILTPRTPTPAPTLGEEWTPQMSSGTKIRASVIILPSSWWYCWFFDAGFCNFLMNLKKEILKMHWWKSEKFPQKLCNRKKKKIPWVWSLHKHSHMLGLLQLN